MASRCAPCRGPPLRFLDAAVLAWVGWRACLARLPPDTPTHPHTHTHTHRPHPPHPRDRSTSWTACSTCTSRPARPTSPPAWPTWRVTPRRVREAHSVQRAAQPGRAADQRGVGGPYARLGVGEGHRRDKAPTLETLVWNRAPQQPPIPPSRSLLLPGWRHHDRRHHHCGGLRLRLPAGGRCRRPHPETGATSGCLGGS